MKRPTRKPSKKPAVVKEDLTTRKAARKLEKVLKMCIKLVDDGERLGSDANYWRADAARDILAIIEGETP